MTVQTRFIVSGAPIATTREKDFEAESPKQAAELAHQYLEKHWEAPRITTEVCIHVREYEPHSGE